MSSATQQCSWVTIWTLPILMQALRSRSQGEDLQLFAELQNVPTLPITIEEQAGISSCYPRKQNFLSPCGSFENENSQCLGVTIRLCLYCAFAMLLASDNLFLLSIKGRLI